MDKVVNPARQHGGAAPLPHLRCESRVQAPPNRVPDMRSDAERAAAALDRSLLLADGTDVAYLVRAARRWLADPPNYTEALIHTQKAIGKAVAGSDLAAVLVEAEGHLERPAQAMTTMAPVKRTE